jgi:dihydrofolate synthase / folylpolyglutamate synthase
VRQSWTYRDALNALWQRSDYDRGFISNPFAGDEAADLGLRRTAALLEELGRPQDRFGIVHVAGSKGKGSTSVFIDAILTADGYRVGRYTQPHLHSQRERIAVAGLPISETAFAALAQRGFEDLAATEQARSDLGRITAFELGTALALAHFADAGCDLAVVEVGLGGTLDATNVVEPLVSVITALDFEHTAILGSTLAEIAAQKAGIIKPGHPVAVSPQPAEALAVIKSIAAERGSPLMVGGRDWTWEGDWRSFALTGPWGRYDDLRSGLVGRHQVENACTAIAATWLVADEHPAALDRTVAISEAAIRTGVVNASWSGRFEVVERDGQRIVLDGAHSPASARALADALHDTGLAPTTVVLGLLGDKDAGLIGQILAPVARGFIVVTPRSPRAASAATVAASLAGLGPEVCVASDVATGLGRARANLGETGTLVVTGSLTTVAEAREALGLAVADPAVDGLLIDQ